MTAAWVAGLVVGCAARPSVPAKPVTGGVPANAVGIGARAADGTSSSVVAESWPEVAEIARWTTALDAGDTVAMARLAEFSRSHAGDEKVREAVLRATQGREVAFFVELLTGSLQDRRDVSPMIEAAAVAVGRRRDDGGPLAVVREVSNQECCMRRSFLAAALEGLGRGLEEAAGGPVVDVEAVLRLEELLGHSDEGLAGAARRARACFALPAGDGGR